MTEDIVERGMVRAPEIHKKWDGLLLCRADGTCRFLTLTERCRYWLTGAFPADAMIAAAEGEG